MRIFRRRRMSTSYFEVPIGVRMVSWFGNKFFPSFPVNRDLWYKFVILALTYLSYMCYHLTRKPISVVKSVLHQNCSDLTLPKEIVLSASTTDISSTWCDYPPFDGTDAKTLFGYLDSGFLFSYAAAMFVSGFIAERVSLRYFLTFGMLFSALFCCLFGIAKTLDIHSLWYFIIIQALAGLSQTTGWPGVVTVVGRWFGKSKRGLIFGIWNSHTSIGNIFGTLIAARYVETNWSLSFVMPGLVMGVVACIMFLFLVDTPEAVGCQIEPVDRRGSYRKIEAGSGVGFDSESDDADVLIRDQDDNNPSLRSLRGSINSESTNIRVGERSPILPHHEGGNSPNRAIGFMAALRIPGVIEFSLCLFFSKLVSYTFLFWLPMYIQSSSNFGSKISAQISTVFDVGGIVGAIAAGVISDYSGMPATTCTGMLLIAAPMLMAYQQWGAATMGLNIVLLIVVGMLVNGPYALITTSVSAELGTHSCLNGNAKALATVTAIIDGTGSIGAAVGPLIAGFVSSKGWDNVFDMLIISDILALILLLRLVSCEVTRRRRNVRIE